jgi:hypothetical protein
MTGHSAGGESPRCISVAGSKPCRPPLFAANARDFPAPAAIGVRFKSIGLRTWAKGTEKIPPAARTGMCRKGHRH